jgi:anaerobic selenocysteine-containing dehydrogenase
VGSRVARRQGRQAGGWAAALGAPVVAVPAMVVLGGFRARRRLTRHRDRVLCGRGPPDSRATLDPSDLSTEVSRVPKDYVRLTTPLVRAGDRRTGTLRPATWDEALDRAAAGLRGAGLAHGPTTFGVFSCSKSTNEVNFAAQKLSRVVLRSNSIDSCNRT